MSNIICDTVVCSVIDLKAWSCDLSTWHILPCSKYMLNCLGISSTDWHCSVHYVTLHVTLTYTQLYFSYCARTSKNLHAVPIFWDELYQYNEGNFEMNTNNTDLIRFQVFSMLCKNRTISLNQTVGTLVTHQFLDSKLIESILLLLSLIGEYSNSEEFM